MYKFRFLHLLYSFLNFIIVQKNDDNQSLFWKQVSSKKGVAHKLKEPQNYEPLLSHKGNVTVEESWAIEIHNENLQRLDEMSEEDILREKSKLEMTLKPELIQFLKSRQNKNQKENQGQGEIKKFSVPNKDENMTSMDEKKLIVKEISNRCEKELFKNNDVTSMQVDKLKEVFNRCNEDISKDNIIQMQINESGKTIIKSSIELMNQAREEGWVHMDLLEPEKLKWMDDILIEKEDKIAPDKLYNARFDFNGKFKKCSYNVPLQFHIMFYIIIIYLN